MTTLAFTENLALADGSYTTVERRIEVPADRVLGQNMGFDAYFAIEGVTIFRGAYWHWDSVPADEAERIRLLDAKEVRALTKNGVIQTNVVKMPDPITDISIHDLETADGPIPQVPSERVLETIEA